MATRLFLDTHAVVWLHQGDLARFTKRAVRALEDGLLAYAPIVRLELEFLFEIGRVAVSPTEILGDLRRDIGLEVCLRAAVDVVEVGCGETWTRDPFERCIVAQARCGREALLTRDRKIQENYDLAFW